MTEVRAYRQKEAMPQDIVQKLHKSDEETAELTLRDIKCPYCGFIVDRVFSDVTGHKLIYCRKCKEEYPINLGYFRRLKKHWHYTGYQPQKRLNR